MGRLWAKGLEGATTISISAEEESLLTENRWVLEEKIMKENFSRWPGSARFRRR